VISPYSYSSPKRLGLCPIEDSHEKGVVHGNAIWYIKGLYYAFSEKLVIK
jgi:hypothetical protein